MYLDVFAKRLKALRLSRNMTLQNVGDAVESKRHSIGNLENSKAFPSLAMVMALADFFDVSVDYLIGRSDDSARPRTGDGDGEMTLPEPAQNPERIKLIAMIEALQDDDALRAMSYVAFLRHVRRREEWKKRRAEGKGEHMA